ncbi:hypothetical protein GCM10009853_010860 [Glycomyces scopariae]
MAGWRRCRRRRDGQTRRAGRLGGFGLRVRFPDGCRSPVLRLAGRKGNAMSDDPIAISPPVPILRIFSVEKALEFYVGYLGFAVAWEHRFEPGMPLYMQVERGAAVLHLSEHHGDGTPGTACFVPIRGIEAFHAELAAKDYPFARPGIEDAPWGSRTLTVGDPFGNHLRFDEAR